MQQAFMTKTPVSIHKPLARGQTRFFTLQTNRMPVNSIPTLPILKRIAHQLPSLRHSGENTLMVGVQHMLPTTATLFHAFHQYLGFVPSHLFFCGKFYSSCLFVENHLRDFGMDLMPTRTPQRPSQYKEQMEESIKTMWGKVETHLQKNPQIHRIIILDEGGYCLETMPKYLPYRYEMACVEQTRFGFYNKYVDSVLFPTIDVARCAAKKELESPLIAQAIIKRLKDVIQALHIHHDKIIGVIGNGAIGHALVQYLLKQGYKVLIYDESESAFHGIRDKNCYRVDSIENLVAATDIVFSCTGRDVSQKADMINAVKNSMTLVSCSSQNIEFFTLIKQITQDSFLVETLDKNLSQLVYIGKNNEKIGILENGFPINFDRTPDCDPVNDMALTRALLFAGVIQALFVAKKPIDDGCTINRKIGYMLDPHVQQFIVKHWLQGQPANRYSPDQIQCFNDVNWIQAHSTGEYAKNSDLQTHFAGDQTESTSLSSMGLGR